MLNKKVKTLLSKVTDNDPVQVAIVTECLAIASLLLKKNEDYGNSALVPARIFSKASAREQILVRIDDKLSRIKNMDLGSEPVPLRDKDGNILYDEDGKALIDEDTIQDLIGYLILLRLSSRGVTGTKGINEPESKKEKYVDEVRNLIDGEGIEEK